MIVKLAVPTMECQIDLSDWFPALTSDGACLRLHFIDC